MKVIEITINKFWIFPKWVSGIVLYPFIFYNGTPSETLRRHEWVHVRQIRENGWFGFYFKYLKYNFKYGYDENPFEIEAYRLETSSEVVVGDHEA